MVIPIGIISKYVVTFLGAFFNSCQPQAGLKPVHHEKKTD